MEETTDRYRFEDRSLGDKYAYNDEMDGERGMNAGDPRAPLSGRTTPRIGQGDARRRGEMKSSDLFPKTPALSGSLHRERRRCGKANCRCAAGEPHGPYWVRRW